MHESVFSRIAAVKTSKEAWKTLKIAYQGMEKVKTTKLQLLRKDFDPSVYKSIVGSLMYLTATRPDIMFTISLTSRFMERPKEAHWQATKRILRYVKGTKRFGILYTV